MSKFTYKWNLSDLKDVPKNGLKVFSCFACGGGSTMGYKMSGFEVIGCNEIDPEMMAIYKQNHNPKYSYLESIETFKLRNDLPKELYNLDILDGSPPCSSFSMAGSREKAWGKKKKFREGQADQILDDLFFHYIELAQKLQPKIVVAENVKGMLMGNAKGYVKQIINLFNVAGYDVQLFLLNGATMGLPQKRERVFFVCRRKDLNLPSLKIGFDEKIITAKESVSDLLHLESDYKLKEGKLGFILWSKVSVGDSLSKGHSKSSWLGHVKTNPNKPFHTLNAGNNGGKAHYRWDRPEVLHYKWWERAFSFPEDYKYKNKSLARYQMGMSVPPLMMHKISEQIYKQWFSNLSVNYDK